jgi:hypothetical protein
MLRIADERTILAALEGRELVAKTSKLVRLREIGND